jgi:hypothetical protein
VDVHVVHLAHRVVVLHSAESPEAVLVQVDLNDLRFELDLITHATVFERECKLVIW